MANTDKEYWNDLGINGYLYHLRRQGLEDIADYLEECVKALERVGVAILRFKRPIAKLSVFYKRR